MRTLIPVAMFFLAATASAAPCTTATPECTEWLVPGGGPARFMIYRNHSLDAKNEKITRALIMVHGLGRDADNYYRHVMAAAFLAGALDDTVVIATRIASTSGGPCRDAVTQGPTRLARGLAYARYVNDKLGAQHRSQIVPACGHSARCMFTHDLALQLIFPK